MLQEIGVLDTRVQMRLYHADFDAAFHDARGNGWEAVHDSDDHAPGQKLGKTLFESGSNGILHRSVRRDGGECLVSFRPKLVTNVRPAGHVEYRWRGTPTPSVIRLET